MADEIRACDAEAFGIDLESAEYSYEVTGEDTIETPLPTPVPVESEVGNG